MFEKEIRESLRRSKMLNSFYIGWFLSVPAFSLIVKVLPYPLKIVSIIVFILLTMWGWDWAIKKGERRGKDKDLELLANLLRHGDVRTRILKRFEEENTGKPEFIELINSIKFPNLNPSIEKNREFLYGIYNFFVTTGEWENFLKEELIKKDKR